MPKNDLKQVETNDVAISDYKVSETTAKYIALRVKLDSLWSDIYDVLAKDFTDKGAGEILDRDFSPSLEKISKELDGYIIDSITSLLPRVRETKII